MESDSPGEFNNSSDLEQSKMDMDNDNDSRITLQEGDMLNSLSTQSVSTNNDTSNQVTPVALGSSHMNTASLPNSLSAQSVSTINDTSNLVTLVASGSRNMNTAKFSIVHKYDETSIGPFLVYVQSNDSNIGMWHPAKLGKMFLLNKIEGIVEIMKISRNRVQVEFISYQAANLLITSSCLLKHNLYAFIPSAKVQRIGIIRNIELDLTDDELQTHLKTDCSILQVKRIMKNSKDSSGAPVKTPTRAVKIWFSGQRLPPKVYLFYTAIVVQPFQFAVIQCRKCLKFGHIAEQCKGSLTCAVCADKHETQSCIQEVFLCTNCGRDDHPATDRKCPQYIRQKLIKEIMAKENCAFHEVFLRYPSLNAEKRSVPHPQFSASEFPKLQARAKDNALPTKSRDRQVLQQLEHDNNELYTTAVKKSKILHNKTIVTTSQDRPMVMPGYDHASHQKTLIYQHGRVPHMTGLKSQTTSSHTQMATDSKCEERQPNLKRNSDQMYIELKNAVDTLEEILMALNNPKFSSLAKMIRTTINSPTRPILVTRKAHGVSL